MKRPKYVQFTERGNEYFTKTHVGKKYRLFYKDSKAPDATWIDNVGKSQTGTIVIKAPLLYQYSA